MRSRSSILATATSKPFLEHQAALHALACRRPARGDQPAQAHHGLDAPASRTGCSAPAGPIVASEWVRALSGTVASPTIGLWSVLFLAAILAIGYFGWRALFRLVEGSFSALNSVVVQPGYATVREVLRQIAESLFEIGEQGSVRETARSLGFPAGLLICTVSLLVLYLVWPSAELFGSFAEIGGWRGLIGVALPIASS